jgi:hypothetical protein
MAKRRATNDQSPKQAILICLGICIPLIIMLGVATYFGFAGQKERDDRATKAEQDKSALQKTVRTSDDKIALLAAYAGLPPEKNGDPATLHDQALTGTDQATANMIKELDKDPGWDPVKRAPKDSLKNRIAKLTTDVEEATKKQAKLKADHDKDMTDLRAANATNKTEEENLRKKLEEIEKKKEDDQEKLLANLSKAQQEINRLRDEIDDNKKKAENQRGSLQAAIDKMTAEKKTQDKKIANMEIKIAPVYLPDFEQPKGKIDAIDPESRFAYLNVGAAEGVKPLLTFSVYSPSPEGKVDLYRAEGNQAERERKRAAHEPVPKGTLEVVSIMGPHASKARITGVRDLNRDPLMRGDYIFNPIWTPNQHMHVAVTGMINLTGDGRDRSAEFIQSLQRMGVIVDSYLDTKDLQIKGSGMNVNTNYLVEGEHPEVNNLLALQGSSIGERSTKIDELINQMKNQAKDLGISTMTARNFMTLVGYRIPRQVTPFAGSSGYATLGGSGESKDEGGKAKKEGEEAPKEKPKAKPKAPAKDMEDDKDKKDADKDGAKKDDAKDDKEAPKDKDK